MSAVSWCEYRYPHLGFLPVHLAQQHKNLVLSTFHQDVVHQMLYERLHGRQLGDFTGNPLWRVALMGQPTRTDKAKLTI